MAGRPLRIGELSTEGSVQRWFIEPLARHLGRHGHTVWRLNGARYSIRRGLSPWDGVAVLRLAWLFRRLQLEVLHVQTAKAGAVGRLAAWLAGVPRVIYTMHDVPFHDALPPWRQRLYVWIERLLGRLCQVITVDSPAVKNRLLTAHVAPARKIAVIPVGVDTARYDPSRFPSHAGRSYLRIGTVARLVPEKGLPVLIDAIARIYKAGYQVGGLIVGEGPLRAELESLVTARGLRGILLFLGEQDDVARCLADMDIFCLPTQREGLSVAVMEAMSMALPVVVSDLPAFRELVIHQQTGFVTKPDGFVAHLLMLIESPELRLRLGRAARAHVERYYEQAAQCQAYERILIGT